jgi:peptide/nickel transport system permease protein
MGITIIIFFVSQVVPSDPAVTLAGDFATEEQIDQIRQKYGLDKPIIVQYINYLALLVKGDMGTSLFTGNPVSEDIKQYFIATMELATGSIIISVIIGIPAGILSAIYRNSILDHLVRFLSLIGSSLPVFWLALVMIAIFYYHLGWFPAVGRIDPSITPPPDVTGSLIVDSLLSGNFSAFWSSLHHLALPAINLGWMGAGLIARVTRSSMLEILEQDYIRTAHAKGVKKIGVIRGHALKNALLPVVTVVGIAYGNLLAGTVLTESIFNWPGLGQYAVDSMVRLDFPAVLGVALVMTLSYSLVNLIVDLTYGVINPQIKYK